MNPSPLVVVLSAFWVMPMSACASDRFQEIQAICRSRAKTIIHDPELFSQWLEAARQQAADQARAVGQPPRVTGSEAVPGFEFRYGPELKLWRDQSTREIRRDDVHLLKDGRPVAQFVDYIVLLDGPIQDTTMGCYGSYPDLYFGGE